MKAFAYLLSQLRQYFADTSFSIWLQGSRDRHLQLYFLFALHPEAENFIMQKPDEVSFASGVDRFRLDEQAGLYYLRFFFAEEGQAVVMLENSESIQPSLTPWQWEILWLAFQLFIAEETIQTKSQEWTKLLQGIHSISATLDVESIIREIIGNALAVIPAADAGLLHLYDEEIDRLVPKATVGFHDTVYQNFKLRSGESIAGKVFQDGQPRMYRTNPETSLAMMDLSHDNFHSLNDAKALHNLSGLLCVPISLEQKRIGVLVLHQFHQENVFSSYDLALLQGFADQTSIALQNARLYAESRQAYQNMAAISEQLRMKHDDLVKRNKIHESIKQLSLQNKDTGTIVKALGRMTAKQVFFADWLEQRYYPADSSIMFSWDELSTLLAGKRQPVSIQLVSGHKNKRQLCYVYPLTNGSVFLGCLIILIKDRHLSELERVTIEQGSAVLTLDLVKKQSLSSVLYKRTHDIFQELIASKGSEMLERARAFGLPPHGDFLVVYAYLSPSKDLSLLEANIHRLVTRWKWEFANNQVLAYGFHNHVTILLTASNSLEVKEMIERLSDAVQEWELEKEISLSIGAGSVVTDLEQIGKSFEEAKKAAHYLANRGRSGVVRYSDLGVNRLMLNQSREDIDAFIHDVFAPLWEGQDKFQELENTLLTYMKCNQSPQQAARDLHIHVNTLYQRLKRIEELLAIDLHHPADLLKVQLACHLREE
ncbi:helix-turn-helix domain-containing protein [Brevibacillus reuszeri]|uniref:helix-turn-helix domain-containing protein n=1 Tax=Brevibacillus reuszeri TaxID=54915 RepID=UPI003D24770B